MSQNKNTVTVKVPRSRAGFKPHTTTVSRKVLPEAKNAPSAGTGRPIDAGPEALGLSSEAEGQRVSDWLLTQRLLHEVGQLEPEKVEALNERLPGWDVPADGDELAHALVTDNTELNNALETWWNAQGHSPEPMSISEIRARGQEATS